MSWLQFSVEVGGEQAEAAAEAFEAAGALSVTELDAGDEALLEPAPGETPRWRRVRVVALFGADAAADRVRAALRQALPGAALEFRAATLADRDWSVTWRDGFHAMSFGEHLWVCPPGEPPPEPDAIVIRMEPGLAFGTGTHETTALCLEWLAAHPPAGRRVIDYGCGSGILAIAAARLGAAQACAVDIDPQALRATRDNAVRNGLADTLVVLRPDALEPQPVDLLIANILANPLIALAGRFAGLVRPAGRILLTGILAGQADTVMAAYREWFTFREPVTRAEWVLLEGVRK
ncbi:MAG: 50S ribosomal protein L11 methyltransferase [Gammaproteobacteria bacterium]|jgi:ribosomal protein L11 methyltransferase